MYPGLLIKEKWLLKGVKKILDYTALLFTQLCRYPSRINMFKTNWTSVLQIYLKETPAKVLSYELCQISKNTIFIKHLCMTASEHHVF